MTIPSTPLDISRTDLASLPIEPSWVMEGAPVARAITLSESPDSLLTTGLWDCTAGMFTWIFSSDEIVQILEGEVRGLFILRAPPPPTNLHRWLAAVKRRLTGHA